MQAREHLHVLVGDTEACFYDKRETELTREERALGRKNGMGGGAQGAQGLSLDK